MRIRIGAAVGAVLWFAALPGSTAQSSPAYPIGKGYTWVFRTDYDPDTDIVHEVTGTEKVGDVECFVVEHRSRNEKEQRTRVLRKEWLAATAEGLVVHKMHRGLAEMPVSKPFFKVKHALKKDDAWEGEARAGEAVVKQEYLVEGEEDVEVPAGKYRAWKIRVRVRQGETHSAEGYEWYAKDVGIVKSEITIRFRGESTTIGSELRSFTGASK